MSSGTCPLCGRNPSRGAGMPHCAPCAKGRRSGSIFAGLTRQERGLMLDMARRDTPGPVDENAPADLARPGGTADAETRRQHDHDTR